MTGYKNAPHITPQVGDVVRFEFCNEEISLRSDLAYSQSSFDRCTIRINRGSQMPHACHLEDCVFILEDGLQLKDFAHSFTQSFLGSTYYNCSVIIDGVQRDLKEAVYSMLMPAAGFES
jgi:hypothetical protein